MSSSERRIVAIDFLRGVMRTRTFEVDRAGTHLQRVARLRADALAHLPGPPLRELLWMRCDGCGEMEHVDAERYPDGWRLDPERGDLCPSCA